MDTNFYIARQLLSGNDRLTEAELIDGFNYVVILAEPGAGKTALMSSIARQLGVTSVDAKVFRHIGCRSEKAPVVIDALDELAKVDESGIYHLLATAQENNPSHVYISCRSSEWGATETNAFQNFFGETPAIVRLLEFSEAEQKEIFENYVSEEDFASFKTEISRFDLDVLLPNPQFLKLFSDAYVESGRCFSSKQSIFKHAIDRLAREANPNIKHQYSATQKIAMASEVFTKLLLSGSESVCISEAIETRVSPCLVSLSKIASDEIFATRLFKPGHREGQHQPTHKIVAEYCAAYYLVKRISDPVDSLTLQHVMPIIAPNSVVRSELRGLLGWMATLGQQSMQEAAIKLDPYAVLANGDPSQLITDSKHQLIKGLIDTEASDPYFRRTDAWRSFSMANFFTKDIAEIIKPVLMKTTGGHLRGLILELLVGSDLSEELSEELRGIVLGKNESHDIRLLANKCLLEVNNYNHSSIIDLLIDEGSNISLSIASEAIIKIGFHHYEKSLLESFLRACIKLYPDDGRILSRTIGEHFFIYHFISYLELEETVWLLNTLTKNLSCICGMSVYDCECRNGISKVTGKLLDQYFYLSDPPHNPAEIWSWVKNLHYHGTGSMTQESKAVQALQHDTELREGMLEYVFGGLTDREYIYTLKNEKFSASSYSHAGLNFCLDDIKFIVDLAFKQGNPALWSCFFESHYFYASRENQGPNELRRYMRQQALDRPDLMKEWAKSNRASKQSYEQRYSKHRRREKRWKKRKNAQVVANQRYIRDNYKTVISGRHWSFLIHFADLILHKPERIEYYYGDVQLVKNALKNSLDFIASNVPDLNKCARLRCASEYMHVEMILHAACLEIWRTKSSLEEVDIAMLIPLRTRLDTGYKGMSDLEQGELKAEIDRLIFPNAITPEKFLRDYLEPQLADSKLQLPDITVLRDDETFSHLRAKLSLEWLNTFTDLATYPLNQLFEIAAQFADRQALKKLIEQRCSTLLWCDDALLDSDGIDDMRLFWVIRGWYFLEDPKLEYWDYLKHNEKTMPVLCERSSRISIGDHPYWPKLSAIKVESVLDTFVEKFPKIDLPNSWGTSSPMEEKGYRFLTDVIWRLDSASPESAIPVITRLIADQRFTDFHNSLKSMYTNQIRKKASYGFLPPSPNEVVDLLDHNEIATVEGLRSLVVQELELYQKDIEGGDFNSADHFYSGEKRLGEVKSTKIIAERMHLRLQPKGIIVTLERQVKDENRVDFTVEKVISDKRRLLVIEVKGQWHKELYTAASEQLYDRYSIHPDAEQQGIFLVIWFGKEEAVAGRKNHGFTNASELLIDIQSKIPRELSGLIDVFVLDVSRS